MYKTAREFEAAFPAIKDFGSKQKTKAFEIFNALKKEGMEDGKAIAITISRVRQMKLSDETFHFSSAVMLSDGAKTSLVEMLRVGIIRDRGLDISMAMLEDYVRNFNDNVYGTDLQVNLGHDRDGEAAGWIRSLYIQGESLMAQVEWTELGLEKIQKKLYQFVSSELAPEYPHAQTGQLTPNVFIGAALTNTPAMKAQTPISLSEQEIDLLTHRTVMLKKLIEDLKSRSKLSESDVKFARTMLEEAAAEDKEAMKTDVEDLEKKQADQAAADAAAAEKAATEAKAAEEQKLSEARKGTVSLSEFNAMKEKLERKELSEKVESGMMLSEKTPVGFRADSLDEVTSFMLSLNETQRVAFTALMGKVASVDFKERGVAGAVENLAEGDEEDAVVAMTNKILCDNKGMKVAEAQKMAMEKVKEAKSKK